MNDNLTPLTYVVLSALGIILAAVIVAAFRWMSDNVRSTIKEAFHRAQSVLLWPVRWVVTEIREWRRLSVYRNRHLSWEDLPEHAKDDVGFQDLSEPARSSIKVMDLPRNEKINLLEKYIVPQIQGGQYEGMLTLFGDNGAVTFNEAAQVYVVSAFDYGFVQQDGLQVILVIRFTMNVAGIPLPMGSRVGFIGAGLKVFGTITDRSSIHPDSQQIALWATALEFDRIMVYGHRD